MQIHIGHLIRDELRRQNRTNAWLADQIGTSTRNLQRIYNKSSIDTQMLLSISQALNTDLFTPYSKMLTSMTDVVT